MKRLQRTGRGLGSEVVLTLRLDEDTEADPIFAEIWEQITSFEKQFSRFLPDSELTHFNQQAGIEVGVTPTFQQVLSIAKGFGEATGGLYNPFILPSLQKSGYLSSWPQSSEPTKQNYTERKAAAVNQLKIGANNAKIPANTALDFGGIGKGYLLDRLADYLQSENVQHFWLSLGGDIICKGNDIDNQPWKIAIQSVTKVGEPVGFITSDDGAIQAVATSGTSKRRGVKEGKQWHHIIDPRTGEPAETDIITATVAASTATEADVFAKCLVILGSTDAKTFLAEHGITKAIIQTNNGGQ